ncbi:polyketide synthase [Colletotrichum higginsianum]|nr:polyketide synthase [Colletotrichum higginsianum]
MVVHACARLDEAVANLRELLKPGGLLVPGEGASDGAMQAGAGFIFGTLPGWWRGVDEGRTLSPLVNASEWEAILKRAGFSGIDTMSPPRLFDAFGITLFVSTAVDKRIEFARDPLATTAAGRDSGAVLESVVIVGGQTPAVADLVKGLSTVLTPLASQVLPYDSLEQLDNDVLDTKSVVFSLADLEAPVFKDLTTERWYNLRKLFETERPLADWWTSRRRAVLKHDALRVQYVNVVDTSKIDPRKIAEYLLRLDAATELDGDDAILYTHGPETIIDAQGRELVPRLFPIVDANNRLNSTTRPIFHPVDVGKSVVELEQHVGGLRLRQLSRYETMEKLMP